MQGTYLNRYAVDLKNDVLDISASINISARNVRHAEQSALALFGAHCVEWRCTGLDWIEPVHGQRPPKNIPKQTFIASYPDLNEEKTK